MNVPRLVYVLESKLPIFAQINVDHSLKTASISCVAISPADHRAALWCQGPSRSLHGSSAALQWTTTNPSACALEASQNCLGSDW